MSKNKRKEFQHALWTKNANIYEVNIRQYTQEGTLSAFKKHLPRLKEMGVDILWFMPIQPIGEKNRKGTLGSNYSVKDYTAVNPEFGTLADFKEVVDEIHRLGMYAIIDWVANHTAWDHIWTTEHPQWYKKDEKGEIHSYVYDNGKELEYWTDVVGLDYTQEAVWDAMTRALMFWIEETGIDGYRCDVAGLVPLKFWEQVRERMDSVKPVFMLAEWWGTDLHDKAFDMTYDWGAYDRMAEISQGKATALDLKEYIENPKTVYPEDAYRMVFTTNHDKNAWEASDQEIYGDHFEVFAALAATLPGMPLIYGGQESGLDKRLAFFEKDPIEWKTFGFSQLYKKLLKMKKDNPALANGQFGGKIEILEATNKSVFAFTRQKEGNAVTGIFNLSGEASVVNIGNQMIELAPWSYKIETK